MTRIRSAAVCALALLAAPAAAQPARPVAAMEWRGHPLSQFRDDELEMPFYLQHFSRLANAVRMDGPDRGFIDLQVWRAPQDNRPYNARIMENITSLAYFYATDRPWNPYHADPRLRARLEAALDFWARSQSAEGRFSEYGPQQWNLAATAFATKFMGETLRLLKNGPPIDAAIHRRAIEADRKAIMEVLESADLYESGRYFSNQYGNVWPGALAYLDLYPDAEMRTLLDRQFHRAGPDHQSVVGYFYEADGPDWSYNLNTHHSNVQMAWSYSRGTPMGDELEAETARWYDWFALNAALEPDGSGFTMNRAIETRQQAPFVASVGAGEAGEGFGPAERVEMARVVGPTVESLAAERTAERRRLASAWPRQDTLVTGVFRSYGPYAFLHRAHRTFIPTDAQQRAARAKLPYIARDRFTHQRMDTRRPVTYTFVRRPAYYAAFNSGELWREQQRYGLGLLWTPESGALLQSQTGSNDAAWGTRSLNARDVYEARTFIPETQAGRQRIVAQAGNHDLPDGDVVMSYPLSTFGTKRVEFRDEGVRVTVKHVEPFVEHIPLLVLPGDRFEQGVGRIALVRGGAERFVLTFPAEARAQVTASDRQIGAKRVTVVTVPFSGELTYTMELPRGAQR